MATDFKILERFELLSLPPLHSTTPTSALAFSMSAPNPTTQRDELQDSTPSLSHTRFSGGRSKMDNSKETKPAPATAPPSTPETPLCTPLKKRDLTYPYVALSRRSGRRPADSWTRVRSELASTCTSLLFMQTHEARYQDSNAPHDVAARPPTLL
jgi:hypothetical protein